MIDNSPGFSRFELNHKVASDLYNQWNKNQFHRFGNRIIEANLHDVQGIDDHQIPGTGDVDFKMIARYLPPTAFRSLEVAPRFSVDELRRGAEVLTHAGCVERIP